MNFDAPIWIPIASATAAWLALFLSLLNFRTSRRALRIAEKQEQRKNPALVLYLQEGFVSTKNTLQGRFYAFLLSVSNRSDNNNAVSAAMLRLTYSRSHGAEITVKIGVEKSIPDIFKGQSFVAPTVPARIDAHQTISGWYFFRVDKALVDGSHIKKYLVVLVDSHGNEIEIEPIIIREFDNEIVEASC